MRNLIVILSVVSGLVGGLCGAVETTDLTAADKIKLAETFADSIVRVEYHLQYDKGQPPVIDGYAERCPHCGEFHNIGDGRTFVEQERPMEVAGYVVAPDRVVCTDLMVHPRFVSKVVVVYKNQQVQARTERVFTHHYAVCLKLEKPLEGIKPIAFKPVEKGPFFLVSFDNANGRWCRSVTPLELSGLTIDADGSSYYGASGRGIVIDKTGVAAGLLMNGRLPTDGSWQGSPLQWDGMSANELNSQFKRIGAIADAALLRVKLNFRSPQSAGRRESYSFMPRADENATELFAVGVVFEPTRALILLTLSPKQTARLDRITFYDASNMPIAAKFEGNLTDYGALICTLEKPISPTIDFYEQSLLGLQDRALTAVEIAILGEQRVRYIRHRRIPGFSVGWKGNLFPMLTEWGMMHEDETMVFLFTTEGKLTAVPMERRQKIRDDEYDWYNREILFFAAEQVRQVLANAAEAFDPDNVPLSEAEENRIAWMGVELQELDAELARINGVSEWTNNGQSGGLVTYVYPGSPADEAGIQMGDILIRLTVADRPKPVEIKVEESFDYGFEDLFQMLDQIPAEYLSELPLPWPSIDSSLNRTLTRIGFGKPYTAELARNGELFKKELTVVESPIHYDSALRYKSASLGVTVRDLTFEVRRFFQLDADAPGVIVSKVEPGSKAFVASIRPYEIITDINDQPVTDVEAFKSLIQQAELKIAVKRMTQGRLVRITHDPAAAEPTTQEPETVSPNGFLSDS